LVTSFEFQNNSKNESANNTLTYENVEVPNSNGALEVHVIASEIDCKDPSYVAAQVTKCYASLISGKVIPTTPLISEPGAFHTVEKTILSTGAAGFAAYIHGPSQVRGYFNVPKSALDGKFYITACLLGVQNTATMSMYWRLDFEIIR